VARGLTPAAAPAQRWQPDVPSLRADVEALAGMLRSSASAGERASAEWVARRLEDAGASDVRLEHFRYQGTYAWVHAAHAVAGLAASRGRGAAAAALSLGALASLELEAGGRRQWLRRLLPAGEGSNVVARVPAAGRARARLLLVAHHDAARTGLVWHPRLKQVFAARQLRRRSIDAAMTPVAAGFASAAAGAVLPGAAGRALRGAGRALLGLALASYIDIATSRTVPGASDNATGVAALIELTRRFAAAPAAGVELLLLAPGCEESGMGGMAAFLRSHAAELRALPTFVLGLDTLGGGTPIVLEAEATMFEHRYSDEDLELADAGAARAGEGLPERWRLGTWTDPVLARFAGLPAISLLSMGPGYLPEHHLPTDTPERVDWDCVARCVRIAGGTVEELAARQQLLSPGIP
jgi:acetylornithine deacetylase/succinyl-diaminopimelate desuccinylase-like protein